MSLESGVHATLAGVVTAMAIPARPKHDPKRFADLFEKLLERYRAGFETGQPLLQNEQARSTLQTIEDGVQGVVPPLQRLEYKLHTPAALLVIPLFAECNARIPLDPESIQLAVPEPVTWGVTAELLAGKVLGITLATWLRMFARADEPEAGGCTPGGLPAECVGSKKTIN
ncbi:MAG: Na+/H+ antiporter NhaA, partial [Gammaproteobacteria bacterium]|nr:Na+/H+ antiporter NhaA [Gammaproteobacteria bacterium]